MGGWASLNTRDRVGDEPADGDETRKTWVDGWGGWIDKMGGDA